jgi:transcriptional regulator with XRE-family HTH domain
MSISTRTPGTLIRSKRTELGWSRRTLADKAGVSEANLARVELYGHTPKLGTLSRIAEALSIPVTDLIDLGEKAS